MKLKKLTATLLAGTMIMGLVACGSSNQNKSVELQVVTSYAGEDSNKQNFQDAVKAYEEASGNKVLDGSATSNEEWKAKVMADFETGSEPDVLFYFTGSDSDKLIEGKKVVSIETIQKEFPEYADNMKSDLLPASTIDGKQYAVPVNGYWEGMFVNKKVLEASGVDVPGKDYTWEQFLTDCQKIKDAGYTPIAASLQEVPHYWFEFTVFNQGKLSNHLEVPTSADDAVATKWGKGLDDIKVLYEKGFFPANTLTAKDAETAQLMIDDQAAFMIDGSWKISFFNDNAANPDNYTVTYVPGQGDRKATDVVGGLSMGYYITEKAWKDEATRKAAVEFVMAMTTNEVVSKFGVTAVTALIDGTIPSDDLSTLELAAIEMTAGSTGVVGATQDGISAEARGQLFALVQDIVTDKMTSQEAIETALAVK